MKLKFENIQHRNIGVSFRQLIDLDVGGELKLLSDNSGFYRPILWVHYLENPNYIEFLKGEELILTTAYTIEKEQDFLDLLHNLNKKNIAGLVISDKDELEKAFYLEAGIKLANKLNIPIFQLPWRIPMLDLTHALCRAIIDNERTTFSINSFFIDIIYGKKIYPADINLAKELGYDPNLTYYPFILEYTPTESDNFISKQKRRNLIIDNLKSIAYNNNLSFIYTIDNNKLLSMVASKEDSLFYPDLFTNAILTILGDYLDLPNINIAIGSFFNSLEEFQDAFLQAIFCLDNKISGKNIYEYQKLPLYQLMYNMNDPKIFENAFNFTLKNLIDYDEINNSNLLDTLKIYLKNDTHIQNTSELLFIHINTLRYRLQRIEEILKIDLRDSETVFNLQLIFQLESFI